MQIVQTLLVNGNDRMVSWLARDPRVRVGTEVTLAKGAGRWRVAEQWSIAEYADVWRDWRVGGL